METAAKRSYFVDHRREEFGSVREACKAAGISESTYYYKPKRDSVAKAVADADVLDLIEKVQAEFAFYGYRRIHEWLERKHRVTINEKKIIRVMKKYGLRALIGREFKVKTTDSDHPYGYAPNLLPGMRLNRVNQVWVADITYIRILTGFVYTRGDLGFIF